MILDQTCCCRDIKKGNAFMIYINTDLEGISGIHWKPQTDKTDWFSPVCPTGLRRILSRQMHDYHARGVICMALVCLLWFGVFTLQAMDRYVVTNGTPGMTSDIPYNAWTNAATNIQNAVNVATNTETVWVSNGVYILTNQIVITNGIVLRSTSGPDATIVNGNFVAGSATTNRCLLLSNASAHVQGFTFSNGACQALIATNGGGGVIMYSGFLSNCTVRNNTVFPPEVNDNGGGGVYMWGNSTMMVCRVVDNVVTGISSGGGGGIYVKLNARCDIVDCLISNNFVTEGYWGGGIFHQGRYSQIRSCMICNNNITNTSKGNYGGGVYLFGYNTTFESNTVTVNQADLAGGCWLARGTITNCVISYNRSRNASASLGAALVMRCDNADIYTYNTTIIGNTNQGVGINNTGSGQGAYKDWLVNCVITGNSNRGVYMGGNYPTNDSLFNCVISGNKIGVECLNGTIYNCLIAGNSNNGTGGGLYIPSCQTALVSSCTIASNYSTATGSGLRIETPITNLFFASSCIIYSNGVSGTNNVYDAYMSTRTGGLQYSCIGSNPGFTGAGIITNNPRFADFAGGNYRLNENSPCVNTGSNETWMTNACDLDGRTRIRYGTVDMGAYELIHWGTIFVAY